MYWRISTTPHDTSSAHYTLTVHDEVIVRWLYCQASLCSTVWAHPALFEPAPRRGLDVMKNGCKSVVCLPHTWAGAGVHFGNYHCDGADCDVVAPTAMDEQRLPQRSAAGVCKVGIALQHGSGASSFVRTHSSTRLCCRRLCASALGQQCRVSCSAV